MTGPAPGSAGVLALLHTSPVHVPVFEALREAHHPGLALRHLVREELLTAAAAEGPASVAAEVEGAVLRAARDGAGAVLCTCSTLGGVAESASAAAGVPVLRVDRPMAAEAVATGPRIVVLAALAETLEPTTGLIAEEARRAGREVAPRSVLVPGAWELFRSGDGEGYIARVAAAAREVSGADVLVLAQASMAPARALLTGGPPVLSSPRPGLAAAARAVRG
ncbi:aspartate/glutamate racemase family protein [Streptomyces physcomitrii]|uniref:Aspartate/glutamate racemase family protein n=1 Tax=Streptomyces physcomitrii TaxID=2724184 RepID=A0ABX1H481_9ACTN|nr:aspartate/glutamate racemase family protein [Streptomyces physcomitrii]NKI42115.1 aspartate/glutamate racemase family protein [Streptomyces physcomitrii]